MEGKRNVHKKISLNKELLVKRTKFLQRKGMVVHTRRTEFLRDFILE